MQTAFIRFVRDILTAWRTSLALRQLHAFTRIAPVGVTSCLLLLSLLCAFCSGCREHSVGTRAEAAPSASRRSTAQSGSASVQQSAEYAQVQALYKAGDHAGALVKIEAMLANPQVTGEQRLFLERQKAICSGKKPDNQTLPSSKASLTPKADCGPIALALVMKRLGVSATPEELGKLAGTGQYGTTLLGLSEAAKAKGLLAEGVQMDGAALRQMEGVAVLHLDGNHYVALLTVSGDRATIHDPNEKNEEEVETDDLLKRSGGILLTVRTKKGSRE